MVNGDELERRIIEQIVTARSAWVPLERLATSIADRDDCHVRRVVAELVEAGQLARWHVPAGILITLTPLAARAKGVEIYESGIKERPRWRVKRRGREPIKAYPRHHAIEPGWIEHDALIFGTKAERLRLGLGRHTLRKGSR